MSYQKIQPRRAAIVVPSDTVDIPFVGAPDDVWACVLYVGTGGDVRVLTDGGDDIVLKNVADGTFLPVQVKRVFSTNTSASGIIALW